VKATHKTKDERFVVHSNFALYEAEIMCCDDPFLMKSKCEKWPGTLYVCVDNVEEMRKRTLKHGFKQVPSVYNPSADGPKDMFWGERVAAMEDPYGHVWVFGQKHSKPKDSAEMKEGEKEWMAMYDGL
jgi:uncharacterized glyoxalase superfamily protein PhnB